MAELSPGALCRVLRLSQAYPLAKEFERERPHLRGRAKSYSAFGDVELSSFRLWGQPALLSGRQPPCWSLLGSCIRVALARERKSRVHGNRRRSRKHAQAAQCRSVCRQSETRARCSVRKASPRRFGRRQSDMIVEWAAVRKPPLLAPDAVHIWFAHLVLEAPEAFHADLSAEEIARADRFLDSKARRAYICSHGLLRHLIAGYFRIHPRDVKFLTASGGKPALQGTNLRFSLSHSGDVALLAFALNTEIGVDIERVDSN